VVKFAETKVVNRMSKRGVSKSDVKVANKNKSHVIYDRLHAVGCDSGREVIISERKFIQILICRLVPCKAKQNLTFLTHCYKIPCDRILRMYFSKR
jgi:hypothetical protein